MLRPTGTERWGPPTGRLPRRGSEDSVTLQILRPGPSTWIGWWLSEKDGSGTVRDRQWINRHSKSPCIEISGQIPSDNFLFWIETVVPEHVGSQLKEGKTSQTLRRAQGHRDAGRRGRTDTCNSTSEGVESLTKKSPRWLTCL